MGRRRGHRIGGGRAALKTGVLISGNGTNLQALLDAGDIDVACVVSSRAEAPGIERARRASVPVIATADEEETAQFLERHGVELVVLAGYMRILSVAFLERFPLGAINVHPSLLPAFPGATAIADALAHGVRVTGVTVHRVDADVDTGPILLQEAVTVPYDDDALDLEDRIHQVEHRLLVQAVRDIRTQGRYS
jgi:phosphoribosylglycinamide formyltransferase 1